MLGNIDDVQFSVCELLSIFYFSTTLLLVVLNALTTWQSPLLNVSFLSFRVLMVILCLTAELAVSV